MLVNSYKLTKVEVLFCSNLQKNNFFFQVLERQPSHNCPPVQNKTFSTIATQTDDNGCNNGCMSMYVNADQSHVSNTSTAPLLQQTPGISNKENSSNVPPIQQRAVVSHKDNSLQHRVGQGPGIVTAINQTTSSLVSKTGNDDVHIENILSNTDHQDLTQELCATSINSAGTSHGDLVSNINQLDCVDQNFVGLEDVDDDSIDNYEKDEEGNVINCATSNNVSTGVMFIDNDHDYCRKRPEKKATNTDANAPKRNRDGSTKSTSKIHKCHTCKEVLKTAAALKQHLRGHAGVKNFECSYCKKKFSQLATLRLHVKFHTGEKLYECSHCKKKFYNKYKLTVHLRMHTDERPFECTYCQKKFRRKENLEKHPCLGVNIALNGGKCSKCKKTLTTKNEISQHILMHASQQSFGCSVCNKRFTHRHMLNQHKKIHAEKQVECSICKKKFVSESYLKRHVYIHFNVKPYECSFCEMKFSSKTNLDRHTTIHTGEKPFQCKFCEKKFARQDYLRKHLISHENLSLGLMASGHNIVQ